MVNVAVFSIKDLIKYVIKLIIVIFFIVTISIIYRYIGYGTHISSIERTIPAIVNYNNKEDIDIINKIEEVKQISFIERILNTELRIRNFIVKNDKQEEINHELDQNDEIKIDVNTEIIQDNNIQTSYTNIYGNVEVKNSSDYQLTDEILTPNIDILNKKDIIIFHTHTSESYTPSESFQYEMTGSYRTTDLNYTVSRVGDELEKLLNNRRI